MEVRFSYWTKNLCASGAIPGPIEEKLRRRDVRFLIIASCNWFVKCYNMKNMIERIKIQNFQSHKSTEMSLSDRVNSIQGNSDCGKSAVMRALNWLMFNPAGDYFISDWARKGKNISEPCEVEVKVDGHTIVRKRSKDFNGYILDGQVFEATRNSVPPQILEVLQMNEVNVQKQLDPPFLLSMSSGDVSRYVNNLVNLTKIDRWTTEVNSRTRRLGQEVESLTERRDAAQKLVESYSFLTGLEKTCDEVELKSKKSAVLQSCSSELAESLEKMKDWWAKLDSVPDVDRLFTLLSELSSEAERAKELEGSLNAIKGALQAFKSASSVVISFEPVETLVGGFSAVQQAVERAKELNVQHTELSSSLKRMKEIQLPIVPEELFSGLELVERWKRIQATLQGNFSSLQLELGRVNTLTSALVGADAEFKSCAEKLSTMVCPLCGRRGIHEEESK